VRRRALLAAGLITAVAIFLAFVPAHRGFFDVGVYHGAVHHWLRDGGDLYDYVRGNTRYGFTYPPFAALVLSPLALLDWHPAIAASLVLNTVAGALLVRLLVGRATWFTYTVATCAFAIFEPVRDTFSFGQVNLVLLALVVADTRLLRGTRFAGVGIGLATAVKLTPGIFLLYLVVTGQRRAAAVATGTAAGATLLAVAVAPDASRTFWTEALWHTGRVGDLAYVSNQSLQGVLARLDPAAPSRLGWLVAVAVVLVVWAYRVRRADPLTGVALTGVVGCLVSPITWVHHLVWVLPALVLLAGHRRVLAGALYAVLSSSLVWLWWSGGPFAFAGANAYVWICLGLLLALPLRDVGERQPVPVDAQPGDDAGGDRRDHRVVPELLALVDVRDVHLDQRPGQLRARVAHRDRVVRPGGAVQHDRDRRVGGLVQPRDHLALEGGLADLDVEAEFLALRHAHLDEVGVGGAAVDERLAGA
jgi:alpha-1,2-mannosyltransferase